MHVLCLGRAGGGSSPSRTGRADQENVRVYLSCTTPAASAQTSSTQTTIMAASATRQRIWALRGGVLKSRRTHVKTVCIYTWLIYTLHLQRAAAEPSACICTCLTRCSQHTHPRALLTMMLPMMTMPSHFIPPHGAQQQHQQRSRTRRQPQQQPPPLTSSAR